LELVVTAVKFDGTAIEILLDGWTSQIEMSNLELRSTYADTHKAKSQSEDWRFASLWWAHLLSNSYVKTA
jgi:hypothetical protein